jgi:hypothetical protein
MTRRSHPIVSLAAPSLCSRACIGCGPGPRPRASSRRSLCAHTPCSCLGGMCTRRPSSPCCCRGGTRCWSDGLSAPRWCVLHRLQRPWRVDAYWPISNGLCPPQHPRGPVRAPRPAVLHRGAGRAVRTVPAAVQTRGYGGPALSRVVMMASVLSPFCPRYSKTNPRAILATHWDGLVIVMSCPSETAIKTSILVAYACFATYALPAVRCAH